METSSATTLLERPPLPDVAPDAGAIEVASGGQPVLAEIADLADVVDRAMGRVVDRLIAAQREDLAVIGRPRVLHAALRGGCVYSPWRRSEATSRPVPGSREELAGGRCRCLHSIERTFNAAWLPHHRLKKAAVSCGHSRGGAPT